MRRFIGFACFTMLTVSLLLIGCGKEEKPPVEVIRPVKAIKVADFDAVMVRKFPGRSSATREVDLSFRVSGPLITFPVQVGDEVKKGQLLARIDPRDYEVRLRNAEAQLARARANLKAMGQARPEELRQAKDAVTKAEVAMTLANQEYDRVMRIFNKDRGAVSQSMVDRVTAGKDGAEAILRQAREDLNIAGAGARKEDIEAKEADIRSLKAAVDSAKDQLRYTHLYASFDGTIVKTYVENFEDVLPKQRVARLIDSSKIEFKVDVPEHLIILLPYVTELSVEFGPFPGRKIAATIKEVGKEASQTTRTYPVTLIMDQPKDIKIMPGMAGTATAVSIPPEKLTEKGMEVPSSAVFSSADNDAYYVWVIDETTNTAHRREVKVAKLTPLGIRLEGGLKPGEWIATAAVHSIREGQKVRILTEAGKGVAQ